MKRVILTLLILLVAGCSDQTGDLVDPIKVGIIGSLSGNAAEFGEFTGNSQILAIEEINAAGGINGRQIKLILEDSACDGPKSVSAYQKLTKVDDAGIVFSHCSTATLSIAPYADQDKTLIFGIISSNPQISEAGDFVFRHSPLAAVENQMLAKFALDNGFKKVGVLYELDAYPEGSAKSFKKEFEKIGGQVFMDAFEKDSKDYRSQLTKLKGQGIDAIYILPFVPSNGIEAMEQIKELGLKVQIFVQANVGINKDALEKGLMEGAVFAEPDFNRDAGKVKDFLDRFVDRFDERTSFEPYMAGAYDSVFVLKQAIEAVGDDPEAIKEWLYKMPAFEGASGTFTFDQNGDATLDWKLKTIKNGEIMEI